MAIRRNRRGPAGRHPNAERYLSREERAAHLICGTVYRGNCSCADGSAATCSSMKFAAIRVINLIEGRDPEPTPEQRGKHL